MLRQGRDALGLSRERRPPPRNLGFKLSVAQSRDRSCAAFELQPRNLFESARLTTGLPAIRTGFE